MAEHLTRPRRTVTFDEALAAAVRLQQEGELDAAADLYRRLSALAPDHPAVLHFSGMLAHQRGDGTEALRLVRRSLDLEPGRADWYSNLGVVLKTRGQLEEAAEAYRRATALDPGHANAHTNLGVLLKAQGQMEEAEAEYRTAIRLAPEHGAAYHDLGVLLAASGRAREAIACYCRALTLGSIEPGTRTLLGAAYHLLGERDKAIEVFEGWLRESPGDPIATHMLAACSGRDVPARASDAYVAETFDNFAANFDAKLAQLGYRAPALVAAALADSGLAPEKRLAILDAGCGTGLCGPLVAPLAARLVGVDLSAGMLAQARERGVYDELVKEELTAYLEAHPAAYDAIVSADTLVYFGALEVVAASAARALRPGGILVFTVEELADGEGDPAAYRINPHGRYSHRREYVTGVLAAAGLTAHVERAELRMEAGAPVRGLVVTAGYRRGRELP